MASWILVPCLVSLRTEFNTLAPSRDRASDGSIGDSAHASSSSDHNPDETGATPYEDADSRNEVHAIDVDADLRKSGWTMERAVDLIVSRHRRGLDNRLQNVIYNGRIWSRSWGWTERTYTGSNKHNKHAHFSARYTTAQESDTRRWGLLEADDAPAPTQPEEDEGVSRQDVADYVHAVAQAVRGEYDAGVTTEQKEAFRKWRADAAAVARFGLGWNFDQQTQANLLPAQFARLASLLAAEQVDVQALGASIGAALAPSLVEAVEQNTGELLALDQVQAVVEAGVKNVLTQGVGG